MADNKENSDVPQMEMCQGPTGFIFIFLTMVTVYVMFNMELRLMLAEKLGIVLYPLIGFNGNYPIITIFLGALLLISVTTSVRHFQTDWIDMARNQKRTKAINKDLRKAKMGGDSKKEREITDYQQKMMATQQNMMFGNLKTMISTLLIVIIIFTWIWGDFITRLTVPILSTPWDTSMEMMKTRMCCSIIPFPKWMIVYMLISVPLGLVIQHTFKMYSFKKRLDEAYYTESKTLKEDLVTLSSSIDALSEKVSFSMESNRNRLFDNR